MGMLDPNTFSILTLTQVGGALIEHGSAVLDQGRWVYVSEAAVTPATAVIIHVTALDRPGNAANKTRQHAFLAGGPMALGTSRSQAPGRNLALTPPKEPSCHHCRWRSQAAVEKQLENNFSAGLFVRYCYVTLSYRKTVTQDGCSGFSHEATAADRLSVGKLSENKGIAPSIR